jgi:hypothetical protein
MWFAPIDRKYRCGTFGRSPLELSDLTRPVVPVYVNGITTIVAASAQPPG